MRDFFDWYKHEMGDVPATWLVLGKGPSLAKLDHIDCNAYHTVSLNHVVREVPVDVAHIIDLDVVEDCGTALLSNCKVLVMPWHPHVDHRPSRENLESLADRIPVLARMKSEGRLLWYNLASSRDTREGSPVVEVRFFSAEAAIDLLVKAGVKTIRSLGVDGGASYSGRFKDLKDKTLLANGRKSFNRQFEQIARIIMKNDLDFAPLDVESPVKVFVATTEAQMLAVKVLEYSIRKHASLSVEVIPIHSCGIEIPTPKDTENRPRTPFSFQRFLIPQLMGYRGRAIYLDSDMQVFSDIRRLWTTPFNDAQVLTVHEPEESGRRPQFSVMLLDCAALDWDIEKIVGDLDAGRLSYADLMYEMKIAPKISSSLDPGWNSLERFEQNKTHLLHYTDMTTQPWISKENPLGYLWFEDLFEAIDSGFISVDYIREHIEKGWIRPSLLYQVENRIADTYLLPKKAREMDRGFAAPYKAIHRHNANPWRNTRHYLRAVARHFLQKSGIYGIGKRIRERFDL